MRTTIDLSTTTLGIKSGLPNINKWLNPDYKGPGDEMVKRLADLPEKSNNPDNWRTDFPEFAETVPELMKMKEELNNAKQEITKIKQQGYDKLYTSVASAFNKYESLRGRNGELAKRFGAEIVSNAWMKMYEAMTLVDVKKSAKQFNSFHIAEAPGNFILAINHFMYNHYPTVSWTWHANSYKNEFGEKEGQYLEDAYGMMRNYPDRWLYGADGDGDITSCANIESFAEKFPGSLDFVTSDVKYVPLVEDYNEEENQNIPVNMGHILVTLRTLKKGGSALLKEFTYFETPKIAQLYLLACVFKEVKIIKPVTSRPANSEVYVLCKDYKANLTDLQMLRLMTIMKYIRYMTDGSPSIFKLADIPAKFVEAVVGLGRILTDQQKSGILRNVELVYAYKHSQIRDIYEDAKGEDRTSAAEKWIASVGMEELPESKRLIKVVHNNYERRDKRNKY